ncbi:diguanylate cyclase [Niveispirillum fermenti]|uniref:GGDEF domain-containing protein n=1 Tax=Niveispirillum fermenti TaxID=1233113 RepID=UPI003A8C54C6
MSRLMAGYLVALTLITLLSGGVHLLLDHVIARQRDAATIINVAGRQRMLSQRIALLGTDLQAGDATARQPLAAAIDLMARSQDALVKGGDLGIDQTPSPALSAHYFEGPAPLDPAVRAFLDEARDFLRTGEPLAYARFHEAARNSLPQALDRAVTLLEQEANARIEWLRQAQRIVLAILLTTLLVEALFIFRPMLVRMRLYSGRLLDMALRDTLTGLANRRHLMDFGETALIRARREGTELSCLLVDLDHFKSINERFGHAVGDGVLVRTAELIQASLRQGDLIGRTGGGEFTIILPGAGEAGALLVAEKLRAMLEADGGGLGLPSFTASIGVTMLVPSDRSLTDLTARADAALYVAKGLGRNRVRVLTGAEAARQMAIGLA